MLGGYDREAKQQALPLRLGVSHRANPSAALQAIRKVNPHHSAIIPFIGIHWKDCQSLIMV
jgi:hypothetical protein